MKINCEYCSIEIERSPSKIKRAKHSTCSKECAAKLTIKLNSKISTCTCCGEEFSQRNSDDRPVCSTKCTIKLTNFKEDSKYKKLYFAIIDNRKANPLLNCYTENHHIIPDSMGGPNDAENMVRLSAREHFLCHYLLTKMIVPYTPDWYKMVKAFMIMKSASNNQERYFNSKLYESKRVEFSEAQSKCQSGDKNSQYGKRWIHLEKINKLIKKDDLQQWLDLGWIKGRWVQKSAKRTIIPKTVKFPKKTVKFPKKCNECNCEYFSKGKSMYCSVDCKRKASYSRVEKQANFYYILFCSGGYSSIREFCRSNDCNKSHVYIMRIFKSCIKDFTTTQGKRISSE